MGKTDLERAWNGLSSPVRRRILDLIREGPRTTGELAAEFPELSRYAVMQHLAVLNQGGLLLVRREGRSRLNYLNPVPLRLIFDRWVSDHAAIQAETVFSLKKYIETEKREGGQMNESTFRVVKIESEIRFDASPEIVFAALTTDIDSWWPFRFKPHGRVVFEAHVGGRMFEDWGEGQGAIYGTCVHYEPPLKIGSFGNGSMNQGYSSINWDEVIPDGDGAIYRKSNTMWGHVPTEVEKMFRDGTKGILEKFLRAYVEQGTKYGE